MWSATPHFDSWYSKSFMRCMFYFVTNLFEMEYFRTMIFLGLLLWMVQTKTLIVCTCKTLKLRYVVPADAGHCPIVYDQVIWSFYNLWVDCQMFTKMEKSSEHLGMCYCGRYQERIWCRSMRMHCILTTSKISANIADRTSRSDTKNTVSKGGWDKLTRYTVMIISFLWSNILVHNLVLSK